MESCDLQQEDTIGLDHDDDGDDSCDADALTVQVSNVTPELSNIIDNDDIVDRALILSIWVSAAI